MNYIHERAAQLERKLSLFLGTPKNVLSWTDVYQAWLTENDIEVDQAAWPSPAAMDDHQINLFVAFHKKARGS